jgi:hypothetical protein
VLSTAETARDAGDVLRDLAHASLGRLADPAEQQWRRVTVQLWGEALRDDRVMRSVCGGLDEPIEIIAGRLRRDQRDGSVPAGINPVSASGSAPPSSRAWSCSRPGNLSSTSTATSVRSSR